MVISALKTMTQKFCGKIEMIIVDMPPGTGDTQLTFAQEVKVDGAIIVSTPQDLALLDVKRGIQMFDKTGVKILGLIDNMSFFKGDDGKDYKIFGESGVEKTAKEFKKDFLGHLPIHQDLRNSADKGDPLTHSDPDHEVSKLFLDIAEKIKLTNEFLSFFYKYKRKYYYQNLFHYFHILSVPNFHDLPYHLFKLVFIIFLIYQ